MSASSGERLRPGALIVSFREAAEDVDFVMSPSRAGPWTVGSAVDADIVVRGEGVSPIHASLTLEGAALRVRDLGSATGTFAAGVRIVDACVEPGVPLRIGRVVVALRPAMSRTIPPPVTLERYGDLIGESVVMQVVYRLLQKLAEAEVPGLLRGEPGTGKRLAAEAIHAHGRRGRGPFVVLEARRSLAEIARRGAYEGDEAGVFEKAQGGTLFITDVADLPIEVQTMLLGIVDRRNLRRLAGEASTPFDVRVLCATRRDLAREVVEGRFRADLYHRLATLEVTMPPLRARRGDVPMLVRYFFERSGGDPEAVPSGSIERLQHLAWPGNVRQLREVVSRWLAVGVLEDVEEDDAFELSLDAALTLDLPLRELRKIVRERLERRYVTRVLQAHDGSVTRAARSSGIARRHLQRLKARSAKRGEPDEP
ncbi:MAG: sigma 54-dependent Fis family transcriptional regulator [Deltaproteobacteria bacterium]|nr:sigma 54-dependent Fis family transcriptional regulator [Deltaproteobacteria bacterium]